MLKPNDISNELCRQIFSDALREEVGSGRPHSVESASDNLGMDERTLRSYLDGENLPGGRHMVRMFAFFGPAFTNRILRVAGLHGAAHMAPEAVTDLELNGDVAQVLGDLGKAFRKGFLSAGEKHKARADIRRLVEIEQDWLAEADPLPLPTNHPRSHGVAGKRRKA